MRVPRMTMHQIGIDQHSVEIGAATDRSEHGLEWFWAGEPAGIHFEARHLQVAAVDALVAETTHFYRHLLGQFPGEIVYMDPCSTVGVRWVFVSEKKNFHAAQWSAGVREYWSVGQNLQPILGAFINTPPLHCYIAAELRLVPDL
jgi:hypothetical protein